MPDLKEIIDEIKSIELEGAPIDKVRRGYIKKLAEKRNRNVIIYYSGWLQKPSIPENTIRDIDVNGFMTTFHGLDKSKGLDLILHTPGGDIAATETIVNYLRNAFNCDVSAFIPQIAMSAGTMIACSCKEIFMGKQSSLGPVDPQFIFPGIGQVAAWGILEEVERGLQEIRANRDSQVLWANIFAKYPPTLLGTCEKAIEWSQQITTKWLKDCMFAGCDKSQYMARKVVKTLSSHKKTKSHSRHLSKEQCKKIGLKIIDLEDDSELQDLVLSVHHACMITLQQHDVVKIIENQNDKMFITRIAK